MAALSFWGKPFSRVFGALLAICIAIQPCRAAILILQPSANRTEVSQPPLLNPFTQSALAARPGAIADKVRQGFPARWSEQVASVAWSAAETARQPAVLADAERASLEGAAEYIQTVDKQVRESWRGMSRGSSYLDWRMAGWGPVFSRLSPLVAWILTFDYHEVEPEFESHRDEWTAGLSESENFLLRSYVHDAAQPYSYAGKDLHHLRLYFAVRNAVQRLSRGESAKENKFFANFEAVCRRYMEDGEAFRRSILETHDERLLLRYLFVRNRVFGGQEFGLVPNGVHIFNLGKPHNDTHYSGVEREVAEYRVEGSGLRPWRYTFYLYDRNPIVFRECFGLDKFVPGYFPALSRFYSAAPSTLRPILDSIVPLASAPTAPGKGMDFYWGYHFQSSQSLYDPSYQGHKNDTPYWRVAEQRVYFEALDRAAASGQVPEYVRYLAKLVQDAKRSDLEEDKYFLLCALSGLPYLFARGYLNGAKQPELSEIAFKALYKAFDDEIVPYDAIPSVVIHFGEHNTDLLKQRAMSRSERADWTMEELGHLARRVEGLRPEITLFLLERFKAEKDKRYKDGAIRGLATLYEDQGLKVDVRTLLTAGSSDASDTPLVDRVLDCLLDALAYRKDMTPDLRGHPTLSGYAWRLLEQLGDIRAIEPMLKYYEEAMNSGHVPLNAAADPQYNALARLIAALPPLEVGRLIVFNTPLHPYFSRWRDRLFTAASRGAIAAALSAREPWLERAFNQILDTPQSEAATKPSSNGKKSASRPPAFDSILSYERSYYGILAIPEGEWDDAETIRRQYRKLARAVHPDVVRQMHSVEEVRANLGALPPLLRTKFSEWLEGPLAPSVDYDRLTAVCESAFKDISEAYDILSDERKKQAYDHFSPFGSHRHSEDFWKSTGYRANIVIWPLFLILMTNEVFGATAACYAARYLAVSGLVWTAIGLLKSAREPHGGRTSALTSRSA